MLNLFVNLAHYIIIIIICARTFKYQIQTQAIITLQTIFHIRQTRSENSIHKIWILYKNGYVLLLVRSAPSQSYTCHKSSTLCDVQSHSKHSTIFYIFRCIAKFTSHSATTNTSRLPNCRWSYRQFSTIFRICWCTSTVPKWCTSIIWSLPSKSASWLQGRSDRCPSKWRAGIE